MMKIVVFDSGYGGEGFADYLEQELPVAEIIRVIDWRHASEILSGVKGARKCAETALTPYFNKVDLIVFANYLLTTTSLNFFKRKYQNQNFVGLELEYPCSFVEKDVLFLTTKALAKSMNCRIFVHKLRQSFRLKTLLLDSWPAKIDDGELQLSEIKETIYRDVINEGFTPSKVIIGCSQFNDIIPELKRVLGRSIEICNGTRDVTSEIYKTLKIRGNICKNKRPRGRYL